tara:strand:- start:1751 stop:1933 length:183 start_codon:yes stop_codon:yes gene_type:complete
MDASGLGALMVPKGGRGDNRAALVGAGLAGGIPEVLGILSGLRFGVAPAGATPNIRKCIF